MTTSDLLQLASTIAARLERRGEPCTPEDAIERARAAKVQLAQLEALRQIDDWADTVPMPPLPAKANIAA